MCGPPLSCTLHRLSIGRQPGAAQGIDPARRAALLSALEAAHVGAWIAANRPDGAAVLDAAVYVACPALQWCSTGVCARARKRCELKPVIVPR
jgi:hypothetical protein